MKSSDMRVGLRVEITNKNSPYFLREGVVLNQDMETDWSNTRICLDETGEVIFGFTPADLERA